jgi:hypothetical protein
MGESQASKAKLISTLVVLALLLGCVVTTLMMWWLGNWEAHRWGLDLALRIVWGCWIVIFLATVLTRVTLFGWSFRNYLRWPEGLKTAPPSLPRRPARAPWPKSPAASFSITVVLVSITGAAAVATAVMWSLEGVTGPWVFTLVTQIIWASWWVLCVAAVLTRIAIFGIQRQKATGGASGNGPPQCPGPAPGSGPPQSDEQEVSPGSAS